MPNLSAEQRKAFLATATQADAARVVNMEGKSFRNITRGAFGVFVSRGGTWDDALKRARLAYHEAAGDSDKRRAIVQAFKDAQAQALADANATPGT